MIDKYVCPADINLSLRTFLYKILDNEKFVCNPLLYEFILSIPIPDISNTYLSNIQLLCRNCHRSQMHGLGGPTEKFMMSVPDAMFEALEAERKRRMLDSIQETLRQIVSEHFRT